MQLSDLQEDRQISLSLLRHMSRSALTWDGFLELPLPRGFGARETWELLQDIGRSMGVGIPFPWEGSSEPSWYLMTLELGQAVCAISLECREESDLCRTVSQSSGRHFLTEMRITDLLAAAKLDGLDISEESLETNLRYSYKPSNPAERLIANVLKAEGELAGLASEPFSIQLIDRIHKSIRDGVDFEKLTMRPRQLGISPRRERLRPSESEASEFLGRIADYANGLIGDPHDPPVLRGLMLTDMMNYERPLGVLSSQVGRLLTQLYAIKNGLPLLAYLPLTKARVEWELGMVPTSAVAGSRAAIDNMPSGRHPDCTMHQTVIAQLVMLEIARTRQEIEKWNEQNARIRELLQNDPTLNQRQRSIVARALRSPAATFSIRFHQTRHNIAYATARSDLMGLAEKGYLEMGYKGRAMAFAPSANLEDLIESARI